METMDDLNKTKLDICTMAALHFIKSIKKGKLNIFTVTLYKINWALDTMNLQAKSLKEVIPKEYHEFLPLLSNIVMETLPPHQPYNHQIQLHEGFTPLFGPIYSSSHEELQVLKKWIEKNLSKGFVWLSSSPCGFPILFAPKSGGG
jgi:hypothetical protein